jgi:hypothetical protein
MLASSAHLTRTAHHNNPVDNFEVAQNIYDKHPKLGYTNGNDSHMTNGDTPEVEKFIT